MSVYLLSGGIGSGKSTAAARFRTLGASIVEADRLGHEVLATGTDESRQVLEIWPEVDDGAGGVSRETLGRIVFGDPLALRQLEAITHPAIGRRILEEVAAVVGIVIVEIPVLRDLAGRGWERIVVDAPDDVRIARTLTRDPRRSETEVVNIMNRQPSRGEWLAVADWVVDNSGDLEHLKRQCSLVWERLATV